MKKNKILYIILTLIIMVFVISCEKFPDYVIIEFDTNGGSIVSPVIVKHNKKPKLPEPPTKEGNVFAGWYLDNDIFEIEFTDETEYGQFAENSFTVYAKWIDKKPIFSDQLKVVYEKIVKEQGFAGSYQEWLDSIEGPKGKDGQTVDLKVEEGFLLWKIKNQSDWIELFDLNSLKSDVINGDNVINFIDQPLTDLNGHSLNEVFNDGQLFNLKSYKQTKRIESFGNVELKTNTVFYTRWDNKIIKGIKGGVTNITNNAKTITIHTYHFSILLINVSLSVLNSCASLTNLTMF
jgi:uncharacterized repeat protein (TIGR02543 family)